MVLKAQPVYAFAIGPHAWGSSCSVAPSHPHPSHRRCPLFTVVTP